MVCSAGGKLVIINLQKTPKDKKADLVIHAKCDAIMQQVLARLDIPLPPYIRQDAVCVSHTVKKAKSSSDETPSFSCTIHVHSVHGPKCPLPLVQQVDITFEVMWSTMLTRRTVIAAPRCRPCLWFAENHVKAENLHKQTVVQRSQRKLQYTTQTEHVKLGAFGCRTLWFDLLLYASSHLWCHEA